MALARPDLTLIDSLRIHQTLGNQPVSHSPQATQQACHFAWGRRTSNQPCAITRLVACALQRVSATSYSSSGCSRHTIAGTSGPEACARNPPPPEVLGLSPTQADAQLHAWLEAEGLSREGHYHLMVLPGMVHRGFRGGAGGSEQG